MFVILVPVGVECTDLLGRSKVLEAGAADEEVLEVGAADEWSVLPVSLVGLEEGAKRVSALGVVAQNQQGPRVL